MFPLEPEAPFQNSSIATRQFFSFNMGPFTVYPLFLLPLLFWISPISSSSSTSRSSDTPKEHKLHQGYATQTTIDPEWNDQEYQNSPFYANQPMNLNTPSMQSPPSSQKDRYYSSPQLPYYQSIYPTYNQMYNYPSPSPYSQGPMAFTNVNPYTHSLPPYATNYQSVVYDPYVLMMQMAQAQPSKYQPQSYQSSLLPQSTQLSTMLSQSPQHLFQSVQPSNHPFYSSQPSQQARPIMQQDAQQLLSSLQNDPQSVLSSLSPDSGTMLYTSLSSPSSLESPQLQSNPTQSQSVHMSSYQPSQSSVFSSLSPDTQHLLSSLSPPFGFIDKQVRHPNEDPSDIVKNPPPKAIMTTASDILGLRGHNLNSFTYTPDKHKHTLYKYTNKHGQSKYKRKPPVFQFNKYSSNKPYNFDNRFMPGGLDLQIPKHHKLKSSNGTAAQAQQVPFEDECEDCGIPPVVQDEIPPPPKNYISEPIIPGDSSSPSWEMIEAVMAKTKKDAKPEQPHNILPTEDEKDEKDDSQEIQDGEPIPLFVIGDEDEDSRYFTQNNPMPEDTSFNSFKHQIYRCPSSRDLRELSEAEIYADPLKCDQFYYCKWGRAYVFKCPVNHVFNPFSNACERDEDFACAMSLKKK